MRTRLRWCINWTFFLLFISFNTKRNYFMFINTRIEIIFQIVSLFIFSVVFCQFSRWRHSNRYTMHSHFLLPIVYINALDEQTKLFVNLIALFLQMLMIRRFRLDWVVTFFWRAFLSRYLGQRKLSLECEEPIMFGIFFNDRKSVLGAHNLEND